MKLPSEAKLLRIFIGEADKYEGKPLFEAIIKLARKHNMQGGTILRGLMGFGADSKMHSANILRLSEDLPIVIEIVDSAEKIESFLPMLDNMIKEGMVTLEKVDVIAYRNNTKNDK